MSHLSRIINNINDLMSEVENLDPEDYIPEAVLDAIDVLNDNGVDVSTYTADRIEVDGDTIQGHICAAAALLDEAAATLMSLEGGNR